MPNITLTTVSMKDGSRMNKLVTDYNAQLVKRCQDLGGEWSREATAWYFPIDLTPQLRQICLDIFGVDPLAETPVELVNVRFICEYDSLNNAGKASMWLFGREVLRRPGRDAAVRPGNGVSIIEGGFERHGGSARYPSLGDPLPGTVILIRGVSRPMAEALRKEKNDGVVTIMEPDSPHALLLTQAKAAAATLSGLLLKLDKENRDAVIFQLVTSLEAKEKQTPLTSDCPLTS